MFYASFLYDFWMTIANTYQKKNLVKLEFHIRLSKKDSFEHKCQVSNPNDYILNEKVFFIDVWHVCGILKQLQMFPESLNAQYGLVGFKFTGKTVKLTDVKKTVINTLHMEGKQKKRSLSYKLVIHSVLDPSLFIENGVKGWSVVRKGPSATQIIPALKGL